MFKRTFRTWGDRGLLPDMYVRQPGIKAEIKVQSGWIRLCPVGEQESYTSPMSKAITSRQLKSHNRNQVKADVLAQTTSDAPLLSQASPGMSLAVHVVTNLSFADVKVSLERSPEYRKMGWVCVSFGAMRFRGWGL
ncbi:MAG: hypothetical protein EAZ61_05210 [Oscillatoriales cyanobacterium]|nr:MAG: hypothetical protein EAZ61_05210 [Oscillatoriales cyanobacterium]